MGATRNRGIVLTLVFVVLAAGLTYAATLGVVYAAIAVALAVGLLVLLVVGMERSAIAALALAFGTAPMYRGIESLSGEVGTPTDLLLVGGLVLLFPTLIRQRLEVPTRYLVGLGLVFSFGLIASVVNPQPIASIFSLAQWIFFLGVLPLAIAWWRPRVQIINGLLACYLAGHTISTLVGLGEGAVTVNRYDGLTHHPNAFGLAGMMSVAIVLYLFHQARDQVRLQILLVGLGALSVLSLALSGSRLASVVAVVLIMMVPIVERSAMSGVLLAAAVACGVLALPFLVEHSGEGSTLSRLSGEGTAVAADQSRLEVLEGGIDRFWQSPILGTGLVEIELIHNVFLEVVTAIGVIGFVAYLFVIYVLARPLFSHHPLRRLSYLPWAFIGVSIGLPGLWDRTIWVPLSMAVLAALAPPPRTTKAGRDPSVSVPALDQSVTALRRPSA